MSMQKENWINGTDVLVPPNSHLGVLSAGREESHGFLWMLWEGTCMPYLHSDARVPVLERMGKK